MQGKSTARLCDYCDTDADYYVSPRGITPYFKACTAHRARLLRDFAPKRLEPWRRKALATA